MVQSGTSERLKDICGMESEQNQSRKFRSPPYPSIGLGKAVERARQLYQKALHHGVGVPVLAEAWEYGEKSSALFATAAALIQFGLLTDDGSGSKRKFAVTDVALRIIKDADPASPKRIEALKSAALKPMIHKELWARFAGASDVSTVVLRNYLTLDRGDEGKARYSDQAADDAIRVYRDAISFVGLLEAQNETEESAEQPSADEFEPEPVIEREAPRASSAPAVAARSNLNERELVSGLLSRDSGFRVLVYGPVGPREIDRLIAKLQLDRDILAESE